MDTSFIRGIIPPILTPIDEDERIDEDRLRKQVEYVIKGGVHGILAFGSNGEFYMPEEDELERGLKIILSQTAGRVPVYLGVGAIRTKKCVRLALMGRRLGAAGVSVLQPMFLKPMEDELYEHFRTIACAVEDMPVLLYNNPGRVGYSITCNLVTRLAQSQANIVGIKDSSGDMTLTSELIRRTREYDFKVFGGKDTMIFATLAHGGAGAVCTTANVCPREVCRVYEEYTAGRMKEALEAQYRLNPMRLSMDGSSFPVATKDMANLMGLDMGLPYKPSQPSDEKQLRRMRNELIQLGVLSDQ